MRWERHIARIRGMRNAYKIMVGKTEGKKLLGRPRGRWKYDITRDLREIQLEGG
jgi:hypothetical protein